MSEHSKRIGETAGFSLRRLGKAFGALLGGGRPEPHEQVFIETLFLLFGHLARADGFVSQQEAELGEKLIEQMELNRHGRRVAVEHFERGKQGAFDLGQQMQQFNQVHAPGSARSRELLDVLIELAKADGKLRPAERGLLEKIAVGLKLPADALRRRLEPQPASEPHSARGLKDEQGLEKAYALLALLPSASDDEVRKAYRRLISKLHPDKLTGLGVAPADIQQAEARAREVRAAWERICAVRGIR